MSSKKLKHSNNKRQNDLGMGKDELLKKYLEGKLTSEEERKALHLFAEDQVMRTKLRMEHNLFSSLTTLLDVGMCSESINYINRPEL